MADHSPRNFLLFLVRSLTEYPDAVSIEERSSDDGPTLFEVTVDPADSQFVTDNEVADALHTAFSAYTYKHRIRARLELLG